LLGVEKEKEFVDSWLTSECGSADFAELLLAETHADRSLIKMNASERNVDQRNDQIEVARVKKALEAFMQIRRPPLHIRAKLDLGYRISRLQAPIQVRSRSVDLLVAQKAVGESLGMNSAVPPDVPRSPNAPDPFRYVRMQGLAIPTDSEGARREWPHRKAVEPRSRSTR